MTALASLTATNKALTETQNRISTGFRVADASDNAAYWSIATTMRSDNSALSTVQDALGLGAATVDVAYTGINAAIKVVDQIKSKLVAARQPGVDRGKIQSEITELQSQLRGIADRPRARVRTVSVELWRSHLQRHQSIVSHSRARPVRFRSAHRHRRRRHQAVRRRRPVGHPDTTSTPPTVRDYSVAGEATPRHLRPDRQCRRSRGPRRDHRRGGWSDFVHDGLGHGAGCGQVSHRHPAGPAQGLMDAISRGVGQLVDADMNEDPPSCRPGRSSSSSACRRSASQLIEPDDPVALPLTIPIKLAWARPRARPSFL